MMNDDMLSASRLEDLPKYLQDLFQHSTTERSSNDNDNRSSSEGRNLTLLSLEEISKLDKSDDKQAYLLFRRHQLTQQLARHGRCCPYLILERAHTYEWLEYADLAAADAFVVYLLCQRVLSDEWITDLEPHDLDGELWTDETQALEFVIDALMLLCRCLRDLGAEQDFNEKRVELSERWAEMHPDLSRESIDMNIEKTAKSSFGPVWKTQLSLSHDDNDKSNSRFGMSRREIYPWNSYEPDRNSSSSIQEINSFLHEVAPDLDAKVTALPALNNDNCGSTTTSGSDPDASTTWYQLGLFATRDFAAGTQILEEKSILTAIRPLDDALCDACGADLESIPLEDRRECPGDDCDITFCSEDCARRAATGYHRPALEASLLSDADPDPDEDEDEDEDEAEDEVDPPDAEASTAPFCGNSALHEIGRTQSTTTPEWDLYFLLLTRTIAMSETQGRHALALPSTKYLWGDFQCSSPPSSSSSASAARTLPFSLTHSIALPVQFFDTLLSSSDSAGVSPYSAAWLEKYDFWILQTLYAKFRGVANATQSTFDGKPEVAAVHANWCLANHSCDPNVRWEPKGIRKFMARDAGIKKGEEVFSHYTDVRLGVHERRERLTEVLGGVCQCPRCLREEAVL